ncbi:forkhead box protein H1 [Silurus meridionalis]|uniref:Fork-head domain-containing protein n=1 Tax=Silurus meridionalis TaxID=175797 RepID=A0A8T0AIH8_SILME|nr:forkhead box protein H1 [Silurus meridionalis]KAF7691352.1 hypothetical protein HF521_011649 [Silurus meridionalis]
MTKTGFGSFQPVLRDHRKYKRHTKGTYIGLVAYVIQDSPDKMLTFKQIMKSLGVFVSGDRKGLENNIRVCLSSNKCFVKVPIDPEYPNAKRNFWRVDEESITPKMLRRHFSDVPGLPPTFLDRKRSAQSASSLPVSSEKIEERPIKFTGPFSIESLLKKDHDTDSLTCLGRENRHYSLYSVCKSVEEASWRKPVQRMDFSSEVHHAMRYSTQFPYDQTVLTKVSSFPLNTHQLTYRQW